MADKKISQLSSYSPINDKVIFPMSYVTSDNKFKTGHTSAKDIKDFVFTYVNENIDIPEVDLSSYASLSYVEDNYIGKGEAIVSVSGNENSFVINGTKYTLSANENGILSVAPFVPVSFTSLSVSPSTLGTTGNDDKTTNYVGTAYNAGTVQKTVTTENITLTINVQNPQGKEFSYVFKNEKGEELATGTSNNTTSVSHVVSAADYFANGAAKTINAGNYTWGTSSQTSTIACNSNKNTNSDGAANETFSAVVTAENIDGNSAAVTKTAKVTGGQSCVVSRTGKVCVVYRVSYTNADGDLSYYSDSNLGGDIAYGSSYNGKVLSARTALAGGTTPYVLIPTCLSKDLKVFDPDLGSSITNWLNVGTVDYNYNNTASINYQVWSPGAIGGAAAVKLTL
jgi:hypothetical protein